MQAYENKKLPKKPIGIKTYILLQHHEIYLNDKR